MRARIPKLEMEYRRIRTEAYDLRAALRECVEALERWAAWYARQQEVISDADWDVHRAALSRVKRLVEP